MLVRTPSGKIIKTDDDLWKIITWIRAVNPNSLIPPKTYAPPPDQSASSDFWRWGSLYSVREHGNRSRPAGADFRLTLMTMARF